MITIQIKTTPMIIKSKGIIGHKTCRPKSPDMVKIKKIPDRIINDDGRKII